MISAIQAPLNSVTNVNTRSWTSNYSFLQFRNVALISINAARGNLTNTSVFQMVGTKTIARAKAPLLEN